MLPSLSTLKISSLDRSKLFPYRKTISPAFLKNKKLKLATVRTKIIRWVKVEIKVMYFNLMGGLIISAILPKI